MSSHHIIRENQEAAIFLVNEEMIVKEALENFFEWSPLIVATEECFVLLHQWGFKTDVLVCDISFEENFETEIAMQQPIELIRIKSMENGVREGLSYLKAKDCPAVNLFIDDTSIWANSHMPDFGNMVINIVQKDQRGLRIDSGLYEKWLPANSKIRIIPFQNDQLFIFKYQNHSAYKQKLSAELVINIESEGIFSISSYQDFQVWEPL